MSKQITATFLFISLTIFVFAQNTVEDYVNRFGSVAVMEMQRTGIPASVILAQGILSSSFGNSQLALQANNHFNLHCDEAWDGELFYKWEDDKQLKHPSCYRVYSKPEESFLEFTNVLSTHREIASLMQYEGINYKQWIKKLVEFGLTPKSEDQMMRVIEQFTLVEFDDVPTNEVAQKNIKREIYYVKGLKAIQAKSNDTPLNIASELNMPYKKILKYNDLQEGENFIENQYIFIEAKRNSSSINEEYHVLGTGETIYDVAQLYGIKLKALCKLNHVNYNDQVASGERIYLVESAPVRPRLQGEKIAENPQNAILLPPPGRNNIETTPIAKVQKEEAEAVGAETTAIAVKVTEEQRDEIPPMPITEDIREETLPQAIVEKEEDILAFSNVAASDNFVVPTPGQTENFGNYVLPNESQPGKTSQTNTFGKQEDVLIIYQKPSKPSFEKLLDANLLEDEVERDEDSAPFPHFEQAKINPAKPITKVKRDGYHIVAQGETLYRISVNYSITVSQIRQWNNLSDNTIEVGQELKIR
jgi:LysM repeat protein